MWDTKTKNIKWVHEIVHGEGKKGVSGYESLSPVEVYCTGVRQYGQLGIAYEESTSRCNCTDTLAFASSSLSMEDIF